MSAVGFLSLFAGLTLGNFICVPMFDLTWWTAFERSFFQGVALSTCYALIRLQS